MLENNSRLNQMADKFMAEGGVYQNRIVDCTVGRLHRRNVLRDYNRVSSRIQVIQEDLPLTQPQK